MYGALFDGSNVWVTNIFGGTLMKLDAAAAILQTVTVGLSPVYPVFDGTNIWVPASGSNSVAVVRASTGAVLATLTGNGMNQPWASAFDGERILVTNFGGGSVSLWKAANFSPLGFFQTGLGSQPVGACSDGINFWIAMQGAQALARF
jgi:DNA-binding beta-propeller fold protein YncE